MTRHYVTDLDLSPTEVHGLLDRAAAMKAQPEEYRALLAGKILGMVFEKKSTRTRVSFEAGMYQLGGQAIFLSAADIQIGRGETIADTGNVLSRYVDILMHRGFAHSVIRELSDNSRVPVINGLDDTYHPCQILADLLTIKEHRGEVRGQQLVYVGDGNNVAHSLMLTGALAGVNIRVITPEGYRPKDDIVKTAQQTATGTGAKVEVTGDLDGVGNADVVYTDVWTSMGQEKEQKARLAAFQGYEVNAAMMKRAKADAIFLHCLPAHRGEEVSAEVIDGPQSQVFDQAENRMHAQKALMALLLGAT